MSEQERDREDARRYRWLRERLFGADFAYGEPAISALIFEWPSNAGISADLDRSIDSAEQA